MKSVEKKQERKEKGNDYSHEYSVIYRGKKGIGKDREWKNEDKTICISKEKGLHMQIHPQFDAYEVMKWFIGHLWLLHVNSTYSQNIVFSFFNRCVCPQIRPLNNYEQIFPLLSSK